MSSQVFICRYLLFFKGHMQFAYLYRCLYCIRVMLISYKTIFGIAANKRRTLYYWDDPNFRMDHFLFRVYFFTGPLDFRTHKCHKLPNQISSCFGKLFYRMV